MHTSHVVSASLFEHKERSGESLGMVLFGKQACVSPLLGGLFPCLVHGLGTPNLAFLQDGHPSPSRLVRSVDISARLDTEPGAGTTSRHATNSRDIYTSSSIELESGFGAVNLEVETGNLMFEGGEQPEWTRAGIDGDGCWVRVENEAIIDVRVCCTENERFVDFCGGVALNFAQRDSRRVNWEVLVCRENRFGAVDCGSVSEVEVAVISALALLFPCTIPQPMIRREYMYL